MVMQELPHPKPCYILKRGAYDAHGDEVSANVPAVLPAMSASEPRNRLGLAEWLFDKSNPLTARVEVNRLWQQMFGQGIVASSDNFGSQGSPPTHPELLDWLACDFRDHGWDVKRMLKEIAMSATYRQSSKADEELLNRDPDNKLLARAPRGAHCRDAPRPGAGRQRVACRKARRSERQALSAARRVGGGDGPSQLRPGPRRRSAPPQPLHLLETQRPAARR